MFANLWKRIKGGNEAPEVKSRGAEGERRAVQLLESKGYRIVSRNWRCSIGELDIVARTGELHVFIEVKSAGRESEFRPEHRVNVTKQRRIKRLAHAYLKANRVDSPVRYDVITVIWQADRIVVNHIENAFS